MALLGLDIEAFGSLTAGIVLRPLAGIETHGIEIGERDGPAQIFQPAPGKLRQMGVE
jgi:hypothetical protein